MNYEYNHFPSSLDLPVSDSALNIDTTTAGGLIQNVLSPLLAQPKSFPFQTELQGNKGLEERGSKRGRV